MGSEGFAEQDPHGVKRVQLDSETFDALMDAIHKVDGMVHTVENISVETGIEMLRSEGRKGAFTATGTRLENGRETKLRVSDDRSTPLLDIDVRVEDLPGDKQRLVSTIQRVGESKPCATVISSLEEGASVNQVPSVTVQVDVQDSHGQAVRHASGSFGVNDTTLKVKVTDGDNKPLPISVELTLDGKGMKVSDATGDIIQGTATESLDARFEVR